jgi:hypothetical protein
VVVVVGGWLWLVFVRACVCARPHFCVCPLPPLGCWFVCAAAAREFARLINTHVKPAPASSDAGAVAEDDAADAAHAAGEEQPGLLSSSTSSLSRCAPLLWMIGPSFPLGVLLQRCSLVGGG